MLDPVDDAATQKPPLLLVLCSILVLATCMFCVSAALATLIITWGPCSFVGGVIVLSLPALLAVQQYRSTFRHNGSAAITSAVMLTILGGLALLVFFGALVEMLEAGLPLPWMALFLPCLAIASVSWTGAWMNIVWSRCIGRDNLDVRRPQIRFSVRELLAAMTVVACMTAMVVHFVRSTPPQYAENVSREEAPFGLPEGARDISFCQGFRGTIAYEFTIDEAGFVEWVDSGIGSLESNAAKVRVKPIDTPCRVSRYSSLSAELTGPAQVTVTNGLSYEWSKQDRGVYAVFDRSKKRAYYFAHSH